MQSTLIRFLLYIKETFIYDCSYRLVIGSKYVKVCSAIFNIYTDEERYPIYNIMKTNCYGIYDWNTCV